METIRKLNLNDLEQMVNLRIAIQNYDLKYINDKDIIINEDLLKEATRKYIAEHLDKNLFMFGLFIGEELVANCGYYLDEHFPTYINSNGYLGYICNVFTKEEYRGKGYQRKVFNECFEYAKQKGITNFKLSSKNEVAINMYKSFGFKQIDNMYASKVN